jgi:hypothetical protein
MVTFTIENKELSKVLKQTRAIYKAGKTRRNALSCEVTVLKDSVEIVSPGIGFRLDALTNGICKFSLPLRFFDNLIDTFKDRALIFKVSEEQLEVENFSCKVKTIFFQDDSVLRSIQLPINFTDADLIVIGSKRIYTEEELEFNEMHGVISNAQASLKDNIETAWALLKVYHVTKDELAELVCRKMGITPEEIGWGHAKSLF